MEDCVKHLPLLVIGSYRMKFTLTSRKKYTGIALKIHGDSREYTAYIAANTRVFAHKYAVHDEKYTAIFRREGNTKDQPVRGTMANQTAGIVIRTVVPFPDWLSIWIEPPWASISARAMDRPKPLLRLDSFSGVPIW
jgi:hypothetical protein